MKYTINDDKGNMICSIENVDPTKSTEMSGLGKAGIVGAGIAVAALMIGKINKTKNINKIIKMYGEKKLKEVGNYINSVNENSFKLMTDFIKKQCKNKATAKFIDTHSYNSNGFISSNSSSNEKKMIKKLLMNSFDDFTFPTCASFKLTSSNITSDKEKDTSDFHHSIIENIIKKFSKSIKPVDYVIENLHNESGEDISEYNQNSKFYITEFTIYYDIKLDKAKLISILK